MGKRQLRSAKTGGGGGGKKSKGGADGQNRRQKSRKKEPRKRKLDRIEAKQAKKESKRKKHHGGDDEKIITKRRMRTKALEKQLNRLKNDAASQPERRKVLLELGLVHGECGRIKQSVQNLTYAQEQDASDPDYAVRVPLLCAHMEQGNAEEASKLVTSDLFKFACGKSVEAKSESRDDSLANRPREMAKTVGLYSRAALKYIKVVVLGDHRTSNRNAIKEEEELGLYLRQARAQNPFVAEHLAFSPVFEPRFPVGAEMPAPRDSATGVEVQIREALEYCCRYRQFQVWEDTNEGYRTFLREQLFDEEDECEDGAENQKDEPPFRPLPQAEAGENGLLTRWRTTREEAMELWAQDLQAEAEADDEAVGVEEGAEEEIPQVADEEEEEEEDSDGAINHAETKLGL